ncbi:MAG: ParB N-terminal domain-containing protein [Chloroflexi bacterium]|nr:ParB N-terminal domain-containing protein [Chloroflexota bacterium]
MSGFDFDFDFAEAVNPFGSADNKIDLHAIRPDFAQPATRVPESVREGLRNGVLTPEEALNEWEKLADDSDKLVRVTWENLRALADNIETVGLIQAILVRENGESADHVYTIVVGERRWWAHQLLFRDGRQPPEIKAEVVQEDNVPIYAKQVSENLSRSDMTVFEKAYSLLALRDLLSDPGRKATWKEVEAHSGIRPRTRNRILSVLSLDEAHQAAAARVGMTENALRPVLSIGDKKKRKRVMADVLEQGAKTRREVDAVVVAHLPEFAVAASPSPASSPSTDGVSPDDEPKATPDMTGAAPRQSTPAKARGNKIRSLARKLANVLFQADMDALEDRDATALSELRDLLDEKLSGIS